MAPSAVETITVPVVNPTKRTHFGAYKELAPTQFDPEAEAGKKGFKGAKVRVYLFETSLGQRNADLAPHSMPTTSQHGTRSRSTQP